GEAGHAVLSGVLGSKAADGVIHAVENGAAALGQGVVSAERDIGRAWENTAGNVADTFKHVGGDVAHAVGDLASGNLGGVWDSAKNFAGDLFNGTIQTDKGLATGILNVINDAGHMAGGIDHAAAEAGSAVLGAAGTATHTIGGIFSGAADAVASALGTGGGSHAVSGAIGAIGDAVAHAAVGNASPMHTGGIV